MASVRLGADCEDSQEMNERIQAANVVIRFAEGDDPYAIQKLLNEQRTFGFVYLGAVVSWLRSRRVLVAIDEESGELVGILVFGIHPATKILQIRAISVRKDYRRRGVGTSLMAAAESLAASSGMEATELLCAVGNPANYFYLSLGYENVGYTQSRKGHVMCCWRKTLR
jgi:ribosomal protein S18 acetylase RimI-like enzyme